MQKQCDADLFHARLLAHLSGVFSDWSQAKKAFLDTYSHDLMPFNIYMIPLGEVVWELRVSCHQYADKVVLWKS